MRKGTLAKYGSATALLLELPLHLHCPIDSDDDKEWIVGAEFYTGTLDIFCLECQKETAFVSTTELPRFDDGSKWGRQIRTETELIRKMRSRIVIWPGQDDTDERGLDYASASRTFTTSFNCPRDNEHLALFVFVVSEGELVKIGQYPSAADLEGYDLRKYRKLLGNDRYLELTKAVGLFSYGVGAGSLIYLRRLFEEEVRTAYETAKADQSWAMRDDWDDTLRVNEKIELLKAYLPPFLVENKNVYGILSSGIHNLDEATCLEYFPPILAGIKVILQQKLNDRERQAQETAARLAIQKLEAPRAQTPSVQASEPDRGGGVVPE